jgi:hypothetical protein
MLGDVPSGVTLTPPARGVPKSTMPSPTRPAQAIHSPMTFSISAGSVGVFSSGVVGAW